MLRSLLHQQVLSTKPGIYFFLGKRNEILYIGKAKNLKNRVSSYFRKDIDLGPKTRILVSQITKINTIEVPSEIEALLLESHYIKKFKPKYNVKLADGKAYPLIRITIRDKYPKVLISRKTNDKKSIYFGPFPNSSAVSLVLKTLRKIFPHQSVANHARRMCLYNHLGLCPCPGIYPTKAEPMSRLHLDNEYKKSIKRIVMFLNGKTKNIIKDLEKERNIFSKNEEFEKAKNIQLKIDAINYVTGPAYRNFDYTMDPNLDTDIVNRELYMLKMSLLKHNVRVDRLSRIECFDISNTSGTNATGSMVVFVNGERDKTWYRRFKIKNLSSLPNLPNDFAMIKQVISRRLDHLEWPYPHLIIVDGGKGQVSSAMDVLKKRNLSIPVIGLAKREEIIITSDFKEIKLPKESEPLKLLMRIRDEAHRFAITYHKKLRSKSFLN